MSEDDSVKHEGKWTRADLPSSSEVRETMPADLRPDTIPSDFGAALDKLVDHLNAHHPKPQPRDCGETIDALNHNRDTLVENRDQSISSLQRLLATAEADRDRWRRARNTTRQERDEWEDKYLNTDEELHRTRLDRDAAIARADQLRDERDDAVQSCMAVGRERDEWKALAEKAHADWEDIAEEFADFRVEVVAEAVKHRESHPHESNADPAVYAVRESDIAAVEVAHDERGWHARGATWSREPTAEGVRDGAKRYLRDVAQYEALARAIEAEQAVDPVEAKARELWETGSGMSVHIEFDDIAPDHRGEYLRLARHLLGQEADHA